MPVKIHQQEGKIVERIDPGEFLAEFDGVKRHGPAIDQADVVEMKIAMHTAHKTIFAALVQEPAQRLQAVARLIAEHFDIRFRKGAPDRAA